MGADGLLADHQLACDFCIGAACDHMGEDLPLTRSQAWQDSGRARCWRWRERRQGHPSGKGQCFDLGDQWRRRQIPGETMCASKSR